VDIPSWLSLKASSAEDAFYVLEAAQSVVFIPGYGMAVAQAQHVVKELAETLENNGAEVRFAIHPVAGRMPGHMNVLLVEADVPFEQLCEMDQVNPIIGTVDVAIVIGANDVVHPAALNDPGSPIYGMPIINAHEAKTVYCLKRGKGAGFSGLENALFFGGNTRMLYGDAKATVTATSATSVASWTGRIRSPSSGRTVTPTRSAPATSFSETSGRVMLFQRIGFSQMPIVATSTYRPPAWLPGGHLQTVHPVLFRKVKAVTNRKERLELDDGDFLDLEWRGNRGERLAIISHGLEGCSGAKYVQGMTAALLKRGWDILAWSFRGCSGEPNRLASFYHSGKTEDLELVVRHALAVHPAKSIDFVGFSLGGNLTLKYVGERGNEIHPTINGAVAFSVPCELACSSEKLAEWQNRIYMERFMKSLRDKVKRKHEHFPNQLDVTGVDGMRTFAEFDDRFTAPLHGFDGASDYWERSSCRQFLKNITIPTLLVSAVNDPILGVGCYPYEEAEASGSFFLETPEQGGHVGFGAGEEYWSEKRAVEFLSTR
jgi:predicted alpha/beta-fold hydrolase|tara:strand:- start:21282 stop:22913 length:1632 start_codon:yes stop_codon:yes gene_type:complete